MKTTAFLKVGMIIVACLLIIVAALTTLSVQAAPGELIQRVYTDKARHNPGDTVTITVEIKNNTGADWSGTLYLDIHSLETTVYSTSQPLSIAAGATTTKIFTWTTPSTDFRGYHVEVRAGTTDWNTTAIDVSSNWTRYPRYGYISEFPTTETAADSQAKVDALAQNYHINAVQLYDWMWRHEKFFKRTNGTVDSTWQDLFDRPISWQTIQNQITALHNRNMAAMAYGMVYAARENYSNYGVNLQWGIYQNNNATGQLNVDFGNGKYLWLFNPLNTNWQNYIFREYQDAIETANFDGIHVDQMGQRPDPYDYWGNVVDLDNSFASFLNNAKEHLAAVAYHTAGSAGQDALTFNIVDGTVDGWAVRNVAQYANTDFNYSEIWWLSNSYAAIGNYIRQVRELSGGKPLVLAAYMNYGENTGPRYEAEDATLNGVGVNNNHAGYTGTGFVDGFDAVGDYVQFSISVPEQGRYALVFRYGNATGATATRNVYVDGTFAGTISFSNQANWDTWAHNAYTTTVLSPGTHTVKLAFDSSNTNAINLDSLTLGTFDEDSVRLADAAFAASGAFHIELGEGDQMLAHDSSPTAPSRCAVRYARR